MALFRVSIFGSVNLKGLGEGALFKLNTWSRGKLQYKYTRFTIVVKGLGSTTARTVTGMWRLIDSVVNAPRCRPKPFPKAGSSTKKWGLGT